MEGRASQCWAQSHFLCEPRSRELEEKRRGDTGHRCVIASQTGCVERPRSACSWEPPHLALGGLGQPPGRALPLLSRLPLPLLAVLFHGCVGRPGPAVAVQLCLTPARPSSPTVAPCRTSHVFRSLSQLQVSLGACLPAVLSGLGLPSPSCLPFFFFPNPLPSPSKNMPFPRKFHSPAIVTFMHFPSSNITEECLTSSPPADPAPTSPHPCLSPLLPVPAICCLDSDEFACLLNPVPRCISRTALLCERQDRSQVLASRDIVRWFPNFQSCEGERGGAGPVRGGAGSILSAVLLPSTLGALLAVKTSLGRADGGPGDLLPQQRVLGPSGPSRGSVPGESQIWGGCKWPVLSPLPSCSLEPQDYCPA